MFWGSDILITIVFGQKGDLFCSGLNGARPLTWLRNETHEPMLCCQLPTIIQNLKRKSEKTSTKNKDEANRCKNWKTGSMLWLVSPLTCWRYPVLCNGKQILRSSWGSSYPRTLQKACLKNLISRIGRSSGPEMPHWPSWLPRWLWVQRLWAASVSDCPRLGDWLVSPEQGIHFILYSCLWRKILDTKSFNASLRKKKAGRCWLHQAQSRNLELILVLKILTILENSPTVFHCHSIAGILLND